MLLYKEHYTEDVMGLPGGNDGCQKDQQTQSLNSTLNVASMIDIAQLW